MSTEEMIKNRVFHAKSKLSDDYYEYMEGEDVKRYLITWKYGEYLKDK